MDTPVKKRIKTEPGLKMADGFSPWEEDEELEDMHSPTDASEDSVEVKVQPVLSAHKRKCAEPRKFGEDVKKRILDIRPRGKPEPEASPFRPWSQPTPAPSGYTPPGYFQEEPLSLVLRDKLTSAMTRAPHAKSQPRPHSSPDKLLPSTCRPRPQDVVRLPHVAPADTTVTVNLKPEYSSLGRVREMDSSGNTRIFSVESLISEAPGTSSSTPSTSYVDDREKQSGSCFQPQQRNYKNMSRERRIEANARERTRVHTISAAFDTLRRSVPAYSHNQKLSKLSVLRIACAYILTLSRVAGSDYSADNSEPSLGDCVDHVTRTIQLEGKLRKKKDD